MDPESLRFSRGGPDRGLRRAPHKERELKLRWRTRAGNSYGGILTRIPEWRMAVGAGEGRMATTKGRWTRLPRDERTWESEERKRIKKENERPRLPDPVGAGSRRALPGAGHAEFRRRRYVRPTRPPPLPMWARRECLLCSSTDDGNICANLTGGRFPPRRWRFAESGDTELHGTGYGLQFPSSCWRRGFP